MLRLFLCCFLVVFGHAAQVGEHATVYFSPDDQVEKRLIGFIEKEKSSIHVAIYCITHRGVGAALIEAKKRGVDVQVIVDRFSMKINSPVRKLVEAGIPVYIWDPDAGNRKKAHRPLMHNKFCVFGDDVIWSGSFNFTYEATRMHQENVLVLRDPLIADAYKNQFTNIRLRSCIPFHLYVAGHHPHKKKRHLR